MYSSSTHFPQAQVGIVHPPPWPVRPCRTVNKCLIKKTKTQNEKSIGSRLLVETNVSQFFYLDYSLKINTRNPIKLIDNCII